MRANSRSVREGMRAGALSEGIVRRNWMSSKPHMGKAPPKCRRLRRVRGDGR
jgi:hypothetical protein